MLRRLSFRDSSHTLSADKLRVYHLPSKMQLSVKLYESRGFVQSLIKLRHGCRILKKKKKKKKRFLKKLKKIKSGSRILKKKKKKKKKLLLFIIISFITSIF